MTNAIVPQEKELYMALSKVDSQIKAVMPKNWDEEDFKRLLSCAALQSRKWGRDAEDRQQILKNLDIGSFIEAVTTAASCNIMPDGRRGYLITRRGKAANFGKGGYTVTFQADYKGLIDVAKRADPRILNIHADTVHMNDVFTHTEGSHREFTHSIPKETLATGRGEVVAAYAIVYYQGGHYDIEIVPLADLKKIMSCSSAGYGPNKDWPLQMHRKAAIRRLCKRLPETPDLARLMDSENSVFDLPPAKEPSKLEIEDLPPVKLKEKKHENYLDELDEQYDRENALEEAGRAYNKQPIVAEPEPEPGAFEPEVDGSLEQRKEKVLIINKLFQAAHRQGIAVPMNVDGDTLYNMSLQELNAVADTLAQVVGAEGEDEELPF